MPWLTVNQTRLLRRSAVPTADFALDVHRGAMPGAPGGRAWDSLTRSGGTTMASQHSHRCLRLHVTASPRVQARMVDYDCAGVGRVAKWTPGVMTAGSTSGDHQAPESTFPVSPGAVPVP